MTVCHTLYDVEMARFNPTEINSEKFAFKYYDEIIHEIGYINYIGFFILHINFSNVLHS